MNRHIVIVVLLLLAGCARYQPRPLSPVEIAKKLDARSLDDPAFKKFFETNSPQPLTEWPLTNWDFDTLTLAALYYHPSLDVARAQWQVALGGKKTAAGRPNPTITAQPGYDFSATGGVNPWLPGVTFDVPIETMGKRGYRKAQAAHLSESARLNIATIAWQVRSNLRSSLIDYSAAREREELLRREQSVHENLVKSLEQQLQAGAVSAPELTQFKVALIRIQLDLADAKRLRADARIRVAEAIGVPVKALAKVHLVFDLSAKHPSAQHLMAADVRDFALQNRADILASLSDYAASQSALQLEIAKQYPDIHFGPYYQYNQGDHQFTLSVTAELPVLNQNQGPIAEAEARRVQLAAQFVALQAKVMGEIDHAVAAFQVARENLSALESLTTVQRQQSEAIEAQLKAGALAQPDVLNSQIELAAGELAQLEGRVKWQLAFAALEDAMQRPIEALKPSLIEAARDKPAKEKKP